MKHLGGNTWNNIVKKHFWKSVNQELPMTFSTFSGLLTAKYVIVRNTLENKHFFVLIINKENFRIKNK